MVSPRSRAAVASGAAGGTPGLFTSRSTPSRSSGSSAPRTTSTPASRSLPASTSSRRSTPTTVTPRRANASAAASPERARPRTSALSGSQVIEVGEVGVVEDEPAGAKDRRRDPEAHHDPGLGPGLHLEVVVKRRHQEDAPPEPLVREDLEDDGEGLDEEDAADQEEEQLGLRHDREGRERAAQPHRAGVSHEDLGREGVVPEEPDRG